MSFRTFTENNINFLSAINDTALLGISTRRESAADRLPQDKIPVRENLTDPVNQENSCF